MTFRVRLRGDSGGAESAPVLTLWRRLTLPLGAWPAQRVTWGLVAVFTAWVLLDVLVLQFSGGLARSTYDTMVRARVYAAAPDPRIVIVDIDEASLLRLGKEFGRWPWPRDTLATVLDHIEKQQPAAIVWDVVFSDADRLSPGGDAAFNAAAQRSAHSHFSVVRLPPQNDGLSQITHRELPGLWLPSAGTSTATVALIPPTLPAVAAARMGYNNGYVDSDGVLRRFRYAESLPDGSAIQSLPLSVFNALNAVGSHSGIAKLPASVSTKDELIVWRRKANSYPSVSFADVFSQADGGAPLKPVPGFAGKVVIIGATAPSLHDVHPTPLSPTQAGVDSLATVIDNALHQRHVGELPRWVQAMLAIALCVGIALWVRVKSVGSLAPALLLLPASLLGISYFSLNALPMFIDLNLSAGLGLVFLAALRVWNGLRRQYWCEVGTATAAGSPEPLAVWCWRSQAPWRDAALDRLIDALEEHAPDCRIITHDINVTWPAALHWPELAGYVAITGPHAALVKAEDVLVRAISGIEDLQQVQDSGIQTLPGSASREALCAAAMAGWGALRCVTTAQPVPLSFHALQGTTP